MVQTYLEFCVISLGDVGKSNLQVMLIHYGDEKMMIDNI